MTERFFKIRNTVTGLYSSGGHSPSWSEKGKEWSKRGHAVSHMSNAVGYRNAEHVYRHAELVEFEYEYNPVIVNTVKLIDIVNEKKRQIYENERKERKRYAKQEYEKVRAVIEEYESSTSLHRY